ncbi:MAG: hypothetical protein J2P17_01340 [Mycobacterium sp.]|nr:hypothetical protein [Mycobacterium sp.]
MSYLRVKKSATILRDRAGDDWTFDAELRGWISADAPALGYGPTSRINVRSREYIEQHFGPIREIG